MNGRYDSDGFFIVDEKERDELGDRCDRQGYLLDLYGERVFSEEIKERLKRRRMKHVKGSLRPKEDEFYAMDSDGIKVNGRYDGEG